MHQIARDLPKEYRSGSVAAMKFKDATRNCYQVVKLELARSRGTFSNYLTIVSRRIIFFGYAEWYRQQVIHIERVGTKMASH